MAAKQQHPTKKPTIAPAAPPPPPPPLVTDAVLIYWTTVSQSKVFLAHEVDDIFALIVLLQSRDCLPIDAMHRLTFSHVISHAVRSSQWQWGKASRQTLSLMLLRQISDILVLEFWSNFKSKFFERVLA